MIFVFFFFRDAASIFFKNFCRPKFVAKLKKILDFRHF